MRHSGVTAVRVGRNFRPDNTAGVQYIGGSQAWTGANGKTGTGVKVSDRGFIDVKVLELDPAKRVLWQVVDGPADWIGRKISFDLVLEDDFVLVFFKHQGWKEPNEFMHHCSTKSALFLMSAKSLVETGAGAPYPNDVHISNKGD